MKKAKEDIAKKCSGDGYEKKKCENAQKKMTEAEKDMQNANSRMEEYYNKYPNERPSDSSSPSPDADTSSDDKSSEDSGKPTKTAEEIAKEYKEKQDAVNEANEKYNEAVGKYANAEKEYYDAAFLCSQGDKNACKTMKDKKEEFAKLKEDADNAYAEKLKADDELNAFLQEYPAANLSGKKNNYDSLNAKVDNLQNQYDQAVKNCEAVKDKNKFYRTPDGTMMTGNDFCDLADSLKDQLAQAKKDRDAAQEAYEDEFSKLNEEQKGYHLMASEGVVNEGIYAQDSDVFKNVTRRAAKILVWLRPVVYLFAAFGLVGFAFAAVFNKISWKWFGNIAIGLFLVANMGRLVEYMVYPTVKDSDSPAGIENTVAASPLSSFGDNLRLTKVLADATYGFVEPVAIYEPTPPKDAVVANIEEVPDEEVPIEEKTKFCRGGGFTSCVSDIINFIKNATNTIDAIKRTATNLDAQGSGIMTNIDNIMSLIKNLNPLSPKQMVNSLGQISTNINQAMNSLKGAMNNISGTDDQIAAIWGAEAGENGLDKARETINNAINSMGNVKVGIDNAINAISGLVNVLGF